MSKYCGNIGFSISEEVRKGIWKNVIEEHFYYGDVLRNARRWEQGASLNDNLNISNQISILADEFACLNCGNIIYAEFMGTLWKVNSIDIQSPRIILSLGGVYNGEQG